MFDRRACTKAPVHITSPTSAIFTWSYGYESDSIHTLVFGSDEGRPVDMPSGRVLGWQEECEGRSRK